ncbi:hypothetical protein SARC_06055 [Sphaeroforma arctica JP610]|uniref:Uncharacterized protein n=1 Tax=Sphaeroforma arctica JP610 TaxID=667725 RepID=A0A0L0FXU4_9EUKA|nr:hypothetical protein SARC_06055 [Sphaeroforma arctica JP610]KNC81632.1 hypothetical protein SARC_06055 [Sphaeroforma arctica JP610]|eukprot:XP_014155534.1 hypothetical protein SARC_06055 [Sphaeroforma arctica JP610]
MAQTQELFKFINEKVLVRQYDTSKARPLAQPMLGWMDNVEKIVRKTAGGYQPKYLILALPQLGHRAAGRPKLDVENTHIIKVEPKIPDNQLHEYFRGLDSRPMYLEVWLVSEEEEEDIHEFLTAQGVYFGDEEKQKSRFSFRRKPNSKDSAKGQGMHRLRCGSFSYSAGSASVSNNASDDNFSDTPGNNSNSDHADSLKGMEQVKEGEGDTLSNNSPDGKRSTFINRATSFCVRGTSMRSTGSNLSMRRKEKTKPSSASETSSPVH